MSPIRTLARHVVPKPAHHTLKKWLDTDYRARWQTQRDQQLAELVFQSTGGLVPSGPFQGLRYPRTDADHPTSPKLLGTHQKELHPIVDQIAARGYRTIVTLGSSDGYYPVGLAQRLPEARVISFQTPEAHPEQVQALAVLNHVADRIEHRDALTVEALEDLLATTPDLLILCDGDSIDADLLDPSAIPSLARAHILLPMHDRRIPGCSLMARQQFQWSHEIEVIRSKPRTLMDWPSHLPFTSPARLACLDESRGGITSWFWMLPSSAFKSSLSIVR